MPRIKAFAFILLTVLSVGEAFGQSITLRVGIYENAPLQYKEANGNYTGLFVELLRYVAEKESWELEFVDGTLTGLFEKLRNNEIDILSDLGRTDYRDSLVMFNKETFLTTWGQIFTKDPQIEKLIDLSGKTISYFDGDVFVDHPTQGLKYLLDAYRIKATLIPYTDYDEVIQVARNDSVDVAVISRLIATSRFSDQSFLDFNRLEPTPIIFAPVDLAYAFSQSSQNEKVAATIDRYIKQFKDENHPAYQNLLQTYMFPDDPFSIPEWLVIILLPLIVLSVFLYGTNTYLRRRVREKTQQVVLSAEQLRLSNERVQTALASSREGVLELDLTNDRYFVDENILKHFDLGAPGIPQPMDKLREAMTEEDSKLFRSEVEKLYNPNHKDKVHRIEHRIRNRAGEMEWISINGKVLDWELDKPKRYLGTISSIQSIKDSQKQKEALLARLKERNKELNCLYQVSNWISDPTKSLEEVFNLTLEQIPKSWQYPSICFGKISFEGKSYTLSDLDETEWSQAADIYSGDNSVGTIQVFYQTEMPQADEGPFLKEERNLLDSLAFLLSTMADRDILESKIANSEASERERISLELHDGVQQTLSAASLNLNYLHTHISKSAGINDKMISKLQVGINNISKAILEIRNLAHAVETNYVYGVQNIISDLEDGPIKFSFQQNLDHEKLGQALEGALLRITQEAISNILKHSEASEASIQLMKYDDLAILTIEDDGMGFEVDDNIKSFGLSGILSRARKLNATCSIDSAQGKGTSITVEVPLTKIE